METCGGIPGRGLFGMEIAEWEILFWTAVWVYVALEKQGHSAVYELIRPLKKGHLLSPCR